ncbi:glycosyltransferase [Stieleria tagensis]|uniref:glycosyltransferase n=1 Tax=Stieleria tagensis TaxID=2956795 RepID=UPI00209AE34C|nr:glycosyltransferase [Stieleria tagensis]
MAFALTLNALVLIYTYVIFPFAMALIGLRQTRTPSKVQDVVDGGQSLSVSLIIPAHNEEAVIAEKIQNSIAIETTDLETFGQKNINLEIVVASDGSTDRTNEICSAEPRIRLMAFDTRRGKSSILNDAVTASRGEIICLCDANVMFRKDALRRLVSHLGDPEVGGVTGDVRLKSEESSFGLAERLYYRLERSIHRGESKLGAVMGVDGGMYVIRRNLFQALPQDTVLDDFSISMNVLRSGKKLLYDHRAIADENATELAADEFRRRVRIGIGAAQVLRRGVHPGWGQVDRMLLFVSHKLLRWLSPLLLILLFSLLIAWAPRNPLAWLVLVPALLASLLCVVGAMLPSSRRTMIVALPFYFILSQIAIAMGLIRGSIFRSSGIWKRTKRERLQDRAVEP